MEERTTTQPAARPFVRASKEAQACCRDGGVETEEGEETLSLCFFSWIRLLEKLRGWWVFFLFSFFFFVVCQTEASLAARLSPGGASCSASPGFRDSRSRAFAPVASSSSVSLFPSLPTYRVARWSSRSCSGDFPRQTRRRSHADLSFQASSGVCFPPSHVAVCSPLFLSPFTRHQTTLPSSAFSRSFASSPFSPNVSASPVFSSRPLSPPFFSYRSLSSSLLFFSKSPLDWSRGSPLLSFPPSCGLSASAPSLRTYSSAGRHSSPFPVSSHSSLFASSSGPSSASLFSPSLCFRRMRNACSRFFSRDASPPSEPSLSLDLLPTLLLSAVKNQNLLLKHTQLVAQKVQCFLSRATHLLARNLREARILLQPVLHLLLVHHHPLFLAASHLIRFFKVLLYLRYLFDWLPQVNPHLPPFTFVYRATDTYISVFTRVVPSIASMDLSGFAAWAVLEMTENYLARIIATLE
ncbi:YGGT family protein [Toxoplasma gondii ARI]|uniref:YGGT family protein n=1 Tax=Toxoplasma gondii ARI TaxID=1074872 RepID=A0A139XY65_TOXGO|nr:YGGT family protein [Toxoplasma gondii ARI]